MTSPARIDANRQNAKKSTGPRTAAGKEKTRLNGLKHGLRSDEVVLPTEDRSAFDSHLAAWMDDWKPPTETRRFLVERAATAAWRLKRCVRNETDRLTDRARRGYAEWDNAHDAAVDRAVMLMPRQPEASVEELLSTREGLRRLADFWIELSKALNNPEGWCDSESHHDRLCYLLGIGPEESNDDLRNVSHASNGLLRRAHLDDKDEDAFDPLSDEMALEVRQMLHAICTEKYKELAVLSAARSAADLGARDRFAERKALEPHPEDATYHRYEGRIDREARAAIAQLMKLEQTGADLVAGDESEAPTEPIAIESEPPTEANKPASDVVAPTEPIAIVPEMPVIRADRPQTDGVWSITSSDDGPRSLDTNL